jgi:hypothetical protein
MIYELFIIIYKYNINIIYIKKIIRIVTSLFIMIMMSEDDN